MLLPLQCTFRGMPHSDALEAHVRRRAGKLDRFFGRIMHCHVVIEINQRHHRHGKRYRVIDRPDGSRDRRGRSPSDARAVAERSLLDDASTPTIETRLAGTEADRLPRVRHKIFGDQRLRVPRKRDGEEVYSTGTARERACRLPASVRYYDDVGHGGSRRSCREAGAVRRGPGTTDALW